MSPPYIFKGSSPQPSNLSTQDFNFRAIIPSVEVADEDPPSSVGGERTPSVSDSEDSSHRAYTPSQSTATPPRRKNLSLGVTESFRTLNLEGTLTSHRTPSWRHDARRQSTGLSPGRSTSTYGGLFNATPEPTPEPSRVQPTLNRDSSVDGLVSDLENSHLHGGGPPSDDSDQLSESDDEDDDNATDSDDSSLYNVRCERLPSAPIYNAGLQEILRDIKSQLSALQNDMNRCSLSRDRGSDLFQLHEKVRMLNELDCPETRTVGFIGNSGVGKSRLINSLLDQEGLARSSGDGAACTSVVTEFRHTDARHPDRYAIEVDYMDGEEVKELLEELVQSFRMYYTDLYREVTSIEEQERIRDRSTRAWSTLNSLFRDQPELTHEFLSDQADGALSGILERLKDWAAQSCTRRPGGAALQHTIIPGNVQECRSHLDMLTMDPRGESEVAIWPFIKLIRVYLRSPVLRTGLVLADLPGFRDLNFARVRATERYLRHSCHEVFVVTTISRCVSDQSIEEIKRRCAQEQPLRIVCTRSEEVNASETARDCRDLRAQIEQLQNRLKQVNKRLVRERNSRRRRTEILQLMENQEDAKLELDRFLVESRNLRVTNQLRRNHGAEVRVFCISNEWYSKYRQDANRHTDTYIELSGIRELRRYCQLVPAEAQFRFTAAFIEHRVPAVVRSVKQWALAGSDDVTAERADALRQILRDVENVFRERLILRNSEVREFPRRLEDRFRDSIFGVTHECCPLWKRSALQASGRWERWHYSTYSAFCRKYGTHSTPGAGGYHCWNEELLEGMQNDLEEPWESIRDWVCMQKTALEETVRRTFEENTGKVEDIMHLAPLALENFIDNMDDWENCVMAAINQSLDQLVLGLSRVETDTLHGHDSSYVAGLMRPVYNECNSESGTGSDARRKMLMRSHLTSSNIFPNLANISEAQCRAVIRNTCQDMRRMVDEVVGNICNDLHSIVAEEGEATEARRFPEMASTLQRKVDAAQATLERAQRIVGDLKNTPDVV
ncbi:hypothetical protein BDV35DRAFT_356397 [Aspergillus flavus]|uniref:Dynamin family protein n=5 Tax=Aspergillus subgen. Circumdati TaxID=2720871 RepID=A0A1S9DPP6_ASPOZ|nr:uncharacterized protein G4B84_006092 [Aspergillus flavus NRRL3357]EIT76021.1 hypothetical protein Ao3042_07909 [Aspergillus oryzae 3.042]KAB8245718.1 hypothetical protein BDV35DRAFT_356397 [Aspergillus flavus]KDE76426.1 hypothetical protein AO1008_02237 [Aspergillus oryzae 100-8]OOO11027.1 Dynamin family protein [Aspergillus oryzae]KAF7625075.1 hypothetical protein AFLA_001949 [Aspergillus flavus NRRL3357]|eukprot:EIT76021.1 hypothetical protein Ao3042_07909 [Aspergillus oryzae 3.042]